MSFFESLLAPYRSIAFGVWGFKDFTKNGFLNREKTFTPNALEVDLSGKIVIVTGANSGLGKITAMELAKRGATVHLVCRNQQAGEEAKDEIIKLTKNPNVFLEVADISRPSQILDLSKKFDKVNILINNAGVLLTERQETPDGLDASFATNTLGTYYLTKLLIPSLRNAEDPRVITVSSGGAYNKGLDVDDLEFKMMKKWSGDIAYAYSKRAQIELTNHWAEKEKNIYFYSMHPGWSDTPGVEKSLPAFYKSLKEKLRSPEEGCDTTIWAAISKEVIEKAPNGSFLFDRAVARQHISLGCTHTKPGLVVELIRKLDDYLTKLGN